MSGRGERRSAFAIAHPRPLQTTTTTTIQITTMTTSLSRAAAVLAAAVALVGLMSATGAEAATHPQDLAALWKFKEEALKMSNNDARWRKVFETWTGRGEACPYPECPHDPCGEDWHGTWHGVQCRELQGVAQWKLPENVYRRVTNMHIPEWGLPGHLPESLCLFEMLEELDFDENAFEGELPACVGCLPHLREIDIEDNKFVGTIPREWGNLKNLVEFEIDGNELLAGCIPEGLPKDAEWCGDCWSTCPSYDPYCGAYDCNSCVSWTKDPEIGTSYENTRIKGERCPNEPNPPVCPWEIFKEEFEEEEAKKAELRKQRAQELLNKTNAPEQLEIRSVEDKPSTGNFMDKVAQEIDQGPAPAPVDTAESPVDPETLPQETAEEEEEEPVSEPAAPAESGKCAEATERVTVDNESCVFPFTVMDQVHCDCVAHQQDSWCTIADGTWKKCAPQN